MTWGNVGVTTRTVLGGCTPHGAIWGRIRP
jgi:hypothetical protein